jgi:hypothetical protein
VDGSLDPARAAPPALPPASRRSSSPWPARCGDAGRDRPRAVALARQAAGIPIRPGAGVTEAEISAWLAAHAPR